MIFVGAQNIYTCAKLANTNIYMYDFFLWGGGTWGEAPRFCGGHVPPRPPPVATPLRLRTLEALGVFNAPSCILIQNGFFKSTVIQILGGPCCAPCIRHCKNKQTNTNTMDHNYCILRNDTSTQSSRTPRYNRAV